MYHITNAWVRCGAYRVQVLRSEGAGVVIEAYGGRWCAGAIAEMLRTWAVHEDYRRALAAAVDVAQEMEECE